MLTEMAGQFLDRLDDETISFRRGSFCCLIAGFGFVGFGFIAFSEGFHGLLENFFGFSLHLSLFSGDFFGRDIGDFIGRDLRGKVAFDLAFDLAGNFFDKRIDRARLLHGCLHFSDDDVGLEQPVTGATNLLLPSLDRLFSALHLDAGLVALERKVGKSLLMETRDVALVFVMIRRPQDRATETAHCHDTEIPRGCGHFDVFGDIKILERRSVE